MKHELGHGVALPHSKGSKTEIMTSRIGTGDNCNKDVVRERLCDFTDYDFERFLWPYDPPSLAEHQNQQEMARLHDERQMRWYETGCPHFPSIGSNGRRLIGCP